MENLRICLAAVFVTGLFVSCTDVTESGNNTLETDSSYNDPYVVMIKDIPPDPIGDWPPYTFGSSGLDFVKLGDTITFRTLNTDASTRDTVFLETTTDANGNPEEIDWIVRIVEFEDGEVLLETDFDSDAFLNRIRIESPRYKHIHTGIHIGSTVKELKDAYGNLHVRPFPEYGVIELIPNEHNVFHIKDTGVITDNPDTWLLSNVPDDLKVIRIVVM